MISFEVVNDEKTTGYLLGDYYDLIKVEEFLEENNWGTVLNNCPGECAGLRLDYERKTVSMQTLFYIKKHAIEANMVAYFDVISDDPIEKVHIISQMYKHDRTAQHLTMEEMYRDFCDVPVEKRDDAFRNKVSSFMASIFMECTILNHEADIISGRGFMDFVEQETYYYRHRLYYNSFSWYSDWINSEGLFEIPKIPEAFGIFLEAGVRQKLDEFFKNHELETRIGEIYGEIYIENLAFELEMNVYDLNQIIEVLCNYGTWVDDEGNVHYHLSENNQPVKIIDWRKSKLKNFQNF